MGGRSLLERWKPAARARTHLLLAAALWSCVGVGLTVAGVHWSLGASRPWPVLVLAAALVLGAAKGRFALERTARRVAARIAARGDGKCLGGFLSWQTWLFVFTMMGMGAALRRSDLPRIVLGLVYATVGVALLWGSRVFWAAWRGTA